MQRSYTLSDYRYVTLGLQPKISHVTCDIGFQSTCTHVKSYHANSYPSQLVPITNSYLCHVVPNTKSYPSHLVPNTNSYLPKSSRTHNYLVPNE